MILSDRQSQEFLKYVKKAEYDNFTFTFGPYDKQKCQYLYGILTDIGVGYYTSHAGNKFCFKCESKQLEATRSYKYRCKECKNEQDTPANSKGPFFITASFNQGTKILKYVSETTNQTFDEITNGKYVEPVKEPIWQKITQVESTPKKPKKGEGRPKKMKKKNKKLSELNVSFKNLLK